jgi:hypothetical protein
MIEWWGNAKVDTFYAHVRTFQRVGERRAWGVLYLFDDARREMAEEILTYKPEKMLASRKWIGMMGNKFDLPALRMFGGDSMIGASPNLDTTRSKYAEKRKRGIWFEYYVSAPADQMYIDFLKRPRLLYFLLIVEAAMVVVLWWMHREIKKLRPET